ncbi:GMC oxidoreductase [Riemerella columbina]|uniref:GMC oxidoreductase n=1 Tax=Riemerella columbina TaxID=103810 RepID=UPI002670B62F|nr:GMC oxidoreductase [Riemerella columbina]WKS94599.1 GMC oxidoreductase [Riemerella columbina]
MKRKEFISTSVLGIGALFFSGIGDLFGRLPEYPEPQISQEDETRPIIIIGSGYGGAVAALRLCEQGHKVTILEMGLDWNKAKIPFSKMMNPGKSAAWLRTKTIAPFLNIFALKKFTGVLDRLDFENIKIWLGRGVGGGSLVNGGIAPTPKKEYFKSIFPNLDADLFYNQYFPLARKELRVELPPEDFIKNCPYYQFTQVGFSEAKKAGFETTMVPNTYDFGYMQKEYRGEVPASALGGEVIYGNNYGKNDLTKTYLRKALETGNLEILDLHQVHFIEQTENHQFRLKVSQISTEGEVLVTKNFNCSKLFVCAGTMGTNALLLKSQHLGKLKIDQNVGKKWGNNGNFMTGRNWVNPMKGGTGVKQSTIPVGAIDHWEHPQHQFFAEIAPLPMGMDVATALYLMVNKIKSYGEIYFDAKKQDIAIKWDKTNYQSFQENAKYFVRKMNKANGGTRAHLLFHNGWGYDICYHPLGGVVLGEATDRYGRLKGHTNLYVLDGALIPGGVGVNPFVTITAIAEYCMAHLLQEGDFSA